MLNLRISQNRRHVKCDKQTAVFVSLEISPDRSSQFAQKRHHVTLAIDCSWSMETDGKIENAKAAAIKIVNSLSPNDLVSVVSFSSTVKIELGPTPASDSTIVNAIQSIQLGAGTALYDGIKTAFELTREVASPDMVQRLMLFSDGEPNSGPMSTPEFEKLLETVRNHGITFDPFGIGNDYNESLLLIMAEVGNGTWNHISNSDDLVNIAFAQIKEMQDTIFTNPQLQITLMPGAELNKIAITKPRLQEIKSESQQTASNAILVGLKDIIKDESQTVAMRISVPPINDQDVSLLTAIIVDGDKEIADQTTTISCTNDKTLYDREIDPSPRILLVSSEAALTIRGDFDDDDARARATSLLDDLDDPASRSMLNDDARATMHNAQSLVNNTQPGMSDSEKKEILHASTMIGVDNDVENSKPTCPECNLSVRPTSKVCGHCGTNLNR